MHRLARLVSGKDFKLQQQWTDALLATLKTPSANKDTANRTTEAIEPEEQSFRKSPSVANIPPKAKPRTNLIMITSAFGLLAMASLTVHMRFANKVTITDIAF